MKALSTTKIRHNIIIEIRDQNGKVKSVELKCNEIKDVALNMFRDALSGTVTDLEIKYVAVGSSNAANATNQTKLVGEFFRKAVTSQTDGATGVLNTICNISTYEANAPKIEEIGWFAGASATATADTGILVARVLYSHQKTVLESINVARVDTIARG